MAEYEALRAEIAALRMEVAGLGAPDLDTGRSTA